MPWNGRAESRPPSPDRLRDVASGARAHRWATRGRFVRHDGSMPTGNEPTIGRFQRNGIGMPGRAGRVDPALSTNRAAPTESLRSPGFTASAPIAAARRPSHQPAGRAPATPEGGPPGAAKSVRGRPQLQPHRKQVLARHTGMALHGPQFVASLAVSHASREGGGQAKNQFNPAISSNPSDVLFHPLPPGRGDRSAGRHSSRPVIARHRLMRSMRFGVCAVTMLATKGGSTFGVRARFGLRAVTMRGLSVVMAGLCRHR